MFIYQKQIDRSTLRQGFTIPVNYHPLLSSMPGGIPKYGETRNIKIIVDGHSFDALLKNQSFDKNKFIHKEIIQIRYNEGSQLVKYLRTIFHVTWDYVNTMKSMPENLNRKTNIQVPNEQIEYLAISATEIENVFLADCITTEFKNKVNSEIQQIEELDFETFGAKEDKSATIKTVTKLQKNRSLDRSIGNSLKQLYDNRCQISGNKIGVEYGASVVEAHHIDYFTKSLNNDTSNIIIIAPNYHRIIHQCNPHFNRDTKCFEFGNGEILGLKLNNHL